MINNLVRKNLLDFTPYTCARDLYSEGIFLDANENSFGSMVKIPYKNQLNRYPDPYCTDLRKAILKYLNCSFLGMENVFASSGSDEIIRLLIALFVETDEEIIVNEPTYGMYRVAADVAGVKVMGIGLDGDFQLDLRRLKLVLNAKTKLFFCCSPNNPTGNCLRADDIVEICRNFRGFVVLDEAYVEFSSQESMVEMLADCPNLLILRTLSKAWGLAGLRLGYMIGNAEVVGYLNKIKLPYNVNSLSQSLGIKALNNVEKMKEVVEQIVRERFWLEDQLRLLGFVIFPSEANFLLVGVCGSGADDLASRIVRNLAIGEKIVVRDFSAKPNLKNCFRITVGTPKQNRLLIQSLTSIL